MIRLICAGVVTLIILELESPPSAVFSNRAIPGAVAATRRGAWQATPRPASNLAEDAFQEAQRLEEQRSPEARLRAVEKYQEALGRWREAGDAGAALKTLLRIAKVRLELRQVDQAMTVAREALAISRGGGDRALEAELHNLLGAHFYDGGDHKRALAEASQALELSRAVQDQRQEARALHIIGNAYHGLDKVIKAIDYQQQALEILKGLGDSQGQLDVMVKMGYAYVNRSEIRRASEIYNEALAISRSIKNGRAEAYVLRALANLKTKVGENQEAFTYLYRALEILETIDDPKIKATVIGGLAYTYECAGDTKKALEKYQEALECFKALKSRWGIAEAEMPIGEIYFAHKLYSEAFSHYETALKHFRAMKMARWEAMTLRNLGLVYDAMGNRPEALHCFRESMALTSAEHDLRSEAYTLSYLGKIYERDGDRSKAQSYYKKALKYSEASSDRAGQSMILFYLAHLARDGGKLDQAQGYINEAISIAEDQRANLVNHELRATYFASAGQYYDLKIDILMRLDAERPNEGFAVLAFETAERARARSLLESLGESRAGIRKGVDPELLKKEQQLQGRLNEIAERQRRLGPAGRQTEEYQGLNREIVQLCAEKQRLTDKIKLTNPQYAALVEPQPLGLPEIQRRLLDGDTVLLEYALGEEKSYLWVVTRDGFRAVTLPSGAEIESAARNFYDLLSSEANASEQNDGLRQEQLRAANRRLSRMLLGSIADQLDRRRILLSSDGFLQLIPFQTLEDPRSNILGKTALMVERHEIINEPSASTLVQLMEETKNRGPQSKDVAVLADPVYGLTDSRSRAATGAKGPGLDQAKVMKELPRTLRDLRGMGGEIPRLYASQFEANSILGLTTGGGGLMAVGFEASRSLAMSSVLSRYRIIHFAAHGVLNEEHPELSGIVLSMVDRFGHPQDGILRLHDIYNLDLPVDLVVLSACNTAQGKEIKGEGLIGLTRGFMYAGAAGVVASLWKVDDEATAELMTGFYRGLLQEKLSAPAALRQAQLAMASQPRWRSPYFWAGFVIQGKYTGSELYNGGQGRNTRFLYFLTIGAAALLFCGLLLLKKIKHGAGRSPA